MIIINKLIIGAVAVARPTLGAANEWLELIQLLLLLRNVLFVLQSLLHLLLLLNIVAVRSGSMHLAETR